MKKIIIDKQAEKRAKELYDFIKKNTIFKNTIFKNKNK